ncbi:exodeoxyribonuclease VII large subunit [Patescibacteria group bacterium]|nr:exodeoxyribonuclease VII large subunit [Patescibacteria group bacterium]
MQKYTVSEFVNFVNAALSAVVFPEGVAIEGEITEYRVSQGKWIWFLLKDQESVVSCFSMTWKLRQPLEDGLQVRVIGQPKIHPRSGKFSINVDRVEPVGEGALKRAYELLKKLLEKEGLFDLARKRSLPRFPERIGLIASRESAAYSDFLRILKNRWGGIEINSLHVQVQGAEAINSIVAAFNYFNVHPELAEVLVLTRGGGSLEDLHAFNAEEVARAVFGSKIPVVVGVGHERDESLADFVADVRASTPSNAAELLVPDRQELINQLRSFSARLVTIMTGAVVIQQGNVSQAVRQIESALSFSVSSFRHRLRDLADAFARLAVDVVRTKDEQQSLWHRLHTTGDQWLGHLTNSLSSKERMLSSFDPQSVLRRGYAIVRRRGQVLNNATTIAVGESVAVQLHHGSLTAKVTKNSS